VHHARAALRAARREEQNFAGGAALTARARRCTRRDAADGALPRLQDYIAAAEARRRAGLL
jgi:hypothetical protein